VAGNCEFELAGAEGLNHLLAGVLDSDHLMLDFADLLLLVLVALLGFSDLLLKALGKLVLLSVAHVLKLLVVANLLGNVLVLLVNHVDVRVEHVHVVEKRIVLLFSLDESRYNFFN
jgi:hypothetical protein